MVGQHVSTPLAIVSRSKVDINLWHNQIGQIQTTAPLPTPSEFKSHQKWLHLGKYVFDRDMFLVFSAALFYQNITTIRSKGFARYFRNSVILNDSFEEYSCEPSQFSLRY